MCLQQQQTLSTYSGTASGITPSASAGSANGVLPSQVQFNSIPANSIAQQYRPSVSAAAPIQQPFNLQQGYSNMPGVYAPPSYPMFYPNSPYQQTMPQQAQPAYYPAPVSNSLFYQQQPSYYPYYPASQRASVSIYFKTLFPFNI